MSIPERDRLARAVHLAVTRTAPHTWLVTGGAEPHVVTADARGRLTCECPDARLHVGQECKHALACRLTMKADPEMLETLRQLVAIPARKRKARD